MLFTISFCVELSALLMAIGLGMFLVTRSAHRKVAWLAALTIWSMGGLFLNMLFSLAPPLVPNWLGALLIFWPAGILHQDPAAWLQGWSSTLAPLFWLHGTMLMGSERLKYWQRLALAGGYVLGVGVIVIQALMPTRYNTIAGDPLFLNALQAGPVYGLSLGTLVLISGVSIRNLILAARAEPRYLPRRQLFVLSAATVLAGLTGPLGLMAAYLKIPVPMFLIALLIGAGVVVTGFGVARYSALMEKRIFVRDFFFTSFIISAAVVLCLAMAWGVNRFYPFPIFFYVLLGIVAVISYSLIDAARQNMDLKFFQHEKQLLRERMHSLEVQDSADLLESLSRLLEIMCEPIQTSYAILLVHENGHYGQVASYRWRDVGLTLPANRLIADDLKLLRTGDLPEPLSNAKLLIPVYLGDQQVGSLVLGAAEHGLDYSAVELDGLREFSDYLGGWLSPMLFQRSEPPELLKHFFPPTAGMVENDDELISSRCVELGLRNLHDYARLAELPLGAAGLVRRQGGINPAHLETGKAVHSVLCQAVEWLRPPGSEEENRINGVPRRDWYPYIILRDAYVNCLPNREIMDRLYISEGTFNRTRRSAIRSLTRQLVEMEKGARQNLIL